MPMSTALLSYRTGQRMRSRVRRCGKHDPCDWCGDRGGGLPGGAILITCPKAHTHAMCALCWWDNVVGYVRRGGGFESHVRVECCPHSLNDAERVMITLARSKR